MSLTMSGPLKIQEPYLSSIKLNFFPPENETNSGFADTGYFYYPSDCVEDGSDCKLVTMLTDPYMDQKRFIDYGFPHIAADNKLILLFPM